VKDVIENAAKLGVEVTIDSLQHFISHLKSYRFIDQGLREGESTWPARQPWTDEERRLYQASMKNLREGHFAEALSFAESLEAASSAKEGARLLKHRVEVAAQGVVELVVTFAAMHATPQATTPVAKPPPAAPVPPMITKHRRALVVGGLVVLLLLVLLRPVEVTTLVACELQVEQLGLPRTLRGGKVAARDVEPGSRVEKGAVLARLGSGEAPAALTAKVKELETALASLPKPVTGKKTDAARGTLQKVQSEMVALEKSRKRGTRAQQQAAEQKLRGKLRELVVAKGALDALTHELTRAPLETELRAVRERKDAALSRSIVIAPVAGVFVGDGALPEELGVNDSYGQIVATDFKLVTRDALPARLDSATFRTGEYEAEVGIVAGQPRFPVRPAFVGAKGTLEVKAGRTPWLFSLFR
jgi:multidrug efflux pump subunit AcrA (membrane-fusion protein)